MNTGSLSRIRFAHDRTALSTADTSEVVFAVGARTIAQKLFRHDPPTPGEIEQAIDWIEEGLAATRLTHGQLGDLQTDEPRLLALLGLRGTGERVTREQVESQFQKLASMSMGRPRGQDEHLLDSMTAALLLILRECMHHLGFEGLRSAS